jgi:hypothetical protein
VDTAFLMRNIMTSGLAKQIGRSNGYTMPDSKEVVKCLHCHRDFERSKTIGFAIIPCPYSDCQGPNYTGDISNSARRSQFEQAVLTYQSKKGMNPPPGLENLHYHQQVHVPVPLEPSTPRAPSTQERNEARGSSLRLHVSKTQTRNNVADLQGNTTQDWAECIRKLVCQQVSEETEGLQRQIKSLQETIDAQQEKIDQLERQIQTNQIPKKIQGEDSGIASESSQVTEDLACKLNELGDQDNLRNWKRDEFSSADSNDFSNGEDVVEADTDLPIPPKNFFVPEWVTHYNSLPLSGGRDDAVNFANCYSAKEVDQTEESLSQYWVGQKEGIYFETNINTGSYWLINSQDQQQGFVHHVVPNKRKFRFIESALPTIKAYFNFSIEGIDSSQLFKPEEVNMAEFQVIHPAEVMEVETNQRWQLQHKGLLKFQPRKPEST